MTLTNQYKDTWWSKQYTRVNHIEFPWSHILVDTTSFIA